MPLAAQSLDSPEQLYRGVWGEARGMKETQAAATHLVLASCGTRLVPPATVNQIQWGAAGAAAFGCAAQWMRVIGYRCTLSAPWPSSRANKGCQLSDGGIGMNRKKKEKNPWEVSHSASQPQCHHRTCGKIQRTALGILRTAAGCQRGLEEGSGNEPNPIAPAPESSGPAFAWARIRSFRARQSAASPLSISIALKSGPSSPSPFPHPLPLQRHGAHPPRTLGVPRLGVASGAFSVTRAPLSCQAWTADGGGALHNSVGGDAVWDVLCYRSLVLALPLQRGCNH
ncbi:hypothetical protein B0H10DRAFT_1951448 [Mycena sp. CBHHK59/15]|nr:hypothetical protein B0H10DRAFT_1951448 [Mycena sp. CBHHK59/15]